jgi:hypothetical protein
MRRRSTMLSSAAAAAFAALAVTVAAPAIGDDGAPAVDDFAACLQEHGLPDAPSGAALKPWLNERLERGDATARTAIDACAPDGPDVSRKGAVERGVRVCLVRHGAQIDGGDPVEVKRWVVEHAGDRPGREVLKRCDVGPPDVAPDTACAPGPAKDPAATTDDPPAPAKPAT